MYTLFNTKNIIKLLAALFITLTVASCQRDDAAAEDDIPQEELTNIVLLVMEKGKPETKASYNYSIGAGGVPTMVLEDGKVYEVEVQFLNGNEDTTQEIKDAKNEHFLTYSFPNSDITLIRTDDEKYTRGDGNRIGLKAEWVVNKAIQNTSSQSQLILTLYHSSVSVSETPIPNGNGLVYGSQTGGETDAQASYTIIN